MTRRTAPAVEPGFPAISWSAELEPAPRRVPLAETISQTRLYGAHRWTKVWLSESEMDSIDKPSSCGMGLGSATADAVEEIN